MVPGVDFASTSARLRATFTAAADALEANGLRMESVGVQLASRFRQLPFCLLSKSEECVPDVRNGWKADTSAVPH